jgi:Stage II sporulation protein E (SpoIIE)
MNSVNPWLSMPRKSMIGFLLAVFFVFTVIGFANDILDMGREPKIRFVLVVVLSGLFAVCYAVGGIGLRKKFWMAVIPIFVAQFWVNKWIATRFPDGPQLAQTTEMQRLQERLTFDAVATIIAVSLGYACFVHVSIREGKRYGKTREEMAVLESEVTAAREVQEVIVPSPGDSYPSFIVESVYMPARQVGGDFFQILPTVDGGLLIVFGDVAGKGLPAAMQVAMIVGLIRATAEYTTDPIVILRKLQERLVDRSGAGFSTALAAHITEDGEVTIANAGQLSPYLDGQEVELAGALPLGVSSGGEYEAVRLELRPGSRLTFFSDGVVEAQTKDGELFGFERARKISTEDAAAIAEAAVRFGQCDDITVVTVQRKSAADELASSSAERLETMRSV